MAQRILLIEGSGRGFLSHYVHALALGLSQAGHEVRLVTGRRDELAGWSVPFAKSPCLDRGLRGWLCLARTVAAFKPQVVHFQWMNDPFFGEVFLRWLRSRGIGVVYTPHNLLPHRGRWLSMPVFRRFYRQIDRIVARDPHMAWAAEEFLGVSQDRLVRLPGSPNLLAHPAMPRAPVAELAPRAEGELRLLHFGHGCRRKGLDLLLRTLAGQDWPVRLHLVLAGEGVLRGVAPQLLQAARAQARITLIDRYVRPTEVATLFASADLLVLPYLKLCNSPLVDLASALRLPVLRSDRVEATSFREGVHGSTLPHGDAAALSAAIRAALDDERLLAAQAAALAREEPVTAQIARLAHSHALVYAALVAAGRRPAAADAALPTRWALHS